MRSSARSQRQLQHKMPVIKRGVVDACKKAVERRQLDASQVGKEAFEKELKKSATRTKSAPISNEGAVALVTIRLSMQSKFDNKMDKNDKVWEDVMAAYNTKVDLGQLVPSDRRNVAGLMARFSKERKAFMEYVAKKRRMAQSGVDTDTVADCRDFWTSTTEIFYDFKYDNRPSINPEHTINGGNADDGGDTVVRGGGMPDEIEADPAYEAEEEAANWSPELVYFDDDPEECATTGVDTACGVAGPSSVSSRNTQVRKGAKLGGANDRKYRPRKQQRQARNEDALLSLLSAHFEKEDERAWREEQREQRAMRYKEEKWQRSLLYEDR